MTSNLHTAILNATKRRKPTSGAGSTYGKGWNAAMDEIARQLDNFEDDGTGESRIRYEWGIRDDTGAVHGITVARTIADYELARQLERHPGIKAELVCSRVVGEMRSQWAVPSEAGSY
jgi:hypothetical protein